MPSVRRQSHRRASTAASAGRSWVGAVLCGGALAMWMGADAHAQDAEPEFGTGEVVFGVRGVGEVWQDAAIIANYRSSRFAGAAFAGITVTDWLQAELEFGYMRQAADVSRSGVAAGSLELVPVTAVLLAVRDGERAEVFGGGGFSLVGFTERTSVGVVAGAKPSLDLRGGTRIHTGLVQPTPMGGTAPGVRRVDVELMLGRRQHHAFGIGTGFDLSAWRVGVGLVARL
jgi:hypothetical protein